MKPVKFSTTPMPGYPPSLPWPPPWRYLTTEVLDQVPVLAELYVKGAFAAAAAEGECSVTQFLESAALATTGRNGAFIRQDSLLVLLVLADREDCSSKVPAQWGNHEVWGKEYYDASARCYYPPVGMLHSAERYVDLFLKQHQGGRILVGIVARADKPTFAQYSTTKRKYAIPVCASGSEQIMPTLRLGAFVDAVGARGTPTLEAQMLDACALVKGDTEGKTVAPLAKRILEVVDR